MSGRLICAALADLGGWRLGLGVVGACALRKTDVGEFELTKMGVLEAARGCKAGEFLLGYPDEYDVLPDSLDMPVGSDPGGLLPTVKTAEGADAPDLGHNGTYLVVRQVAQHVPELWTYLARTYTQSARALAPEKAEQVQRLQGKAVDAIKKAIGMGFRDRAVLDHEHDIDPLRSRPDFQLLLMDLAFPKDPFARGR